MQTNTISTIWWDCIGREGSGSRMMWYFSYLIYANKWEFVWIYQPGHKPVCQLLSHLVTETGPWGGMVGLRLIMHSPISQGKTVPKWGELRLPPLPTWPETNKGGTLICLMVLFRVSGGSRGAFFWRLTDRRGSDTRPSQSQFPFLPHSLKKKKYSVGLTILPLDGMNWELCILSITGIRRRSDCRLAFPFMLSVPLKTVQAPLRSSCLAY